jgi:membrane-associated HD superfamily phosphohydrolase
MCRFYLYVRILYLITEKDKVVKIGITDDIVARESTYKTSEYLPGEFTKVYDITYNGVRCHFDNHFKKITKKYHRYQGAGIEFYSEDLIEKMDSYINKIDNYINFCIKSHNEINKYEVICNMLNDSINSKEKNDENAIENINVDINKIIISKQKISSSMKFYLLKKKFQKQQLTANIESYLTHDEYIIAS